MMKKKSANNSVITELKLENGCYRYNLIDSDLGKDGNYLKLNLTYNGSDLSGLTKNDDESTNAVIKVGKIQNGIFDTKYLYSFSVIEGTNDYIFRLSNDYY